MTELRLKNWGLCKSLVPIQSKTLRKIKKFMKESRYGDSMDIRPGFILIGNVYGSAKYKKGTQIYTSQVMSIAHTQHKGRYRFTLFTRNSAYNVSRTGMAHHYSPSSASE